MFPLKICELNSKDCATFEKYFLENGKFIFEGCWLRNQRPENAKSSGYVDDTTARRRYIHYYDTYNLLKENGKNYLAIKDTYMYVTNTLPVEEIEEYMSRIINALNSNGFVKVNDQLYKKGNMEVIINLYDQHPRNVVDFPDNYKSCDVVIATSGYDYSALQNRMWDLTKKMYRMPDKRGNPKYITSAKEIVDYLPAQIEMGCGPSIETEIPPLHVMHETYKVQNHATAKFYFAKDDDLMESVILDPEKMYKKFAKVPIACIRAEHSQAYKTFDQLYKKGYFVGTVFNNNFDRLVKRLDIPEKILRIYDINTYKFNEQFDPQAKSLICFGCHADRRGTQKKARAQGLKVIHIDPEGYITKDGFESYPVEGPQDEDLFLRLPFKDAMKLLGDQLL